MSAIFALTTRGLESITAGEMQRIPGLRVTETDYRRVTGLLESDSGAKTLKALLGLKTADDLFLHLADWRAIDHTRAALDDLRACAADLNIKALIPQLLTVRPVSKQPRFSVTASFVGGRNYTMSEIKTTVAEGIRRRYPNWQYADDDRESDLNVRVFIEGMMGLVGLRLGAAPLHRRPYKTDHLPGSLKPTVAAAMLLMANPKPGDLLLDPFCGGGTILAEAGAFGLKVVGGDLSAEAISAARVNLTAAASAAGIAARLCRWDARLLPLASESLDVVVSNLPWGRQIAVDDELRSLYGRAMDELRRVLKPDGALIVLTSVPALLQQAPRESLEISLFGQTPVIASL